LKAASKPRKPPPRRASTGPGRPKDLEKRAAILDAAKRLFPEHGYDGVSMDAIAAEAGVSKLTVPQLFLADLSGPLRRQLRSIAQGFFALIMSPEAVAMHRMMHAQAPGHAVLARMFWEAGPKRVQDGFAEFLRVEVEAGQLAIRDLQRAASQFFCLLKGEIHARVMCGCAEPISQREVDAHLDATVDLFLRAYEPR
jgi:TetR/AcrR family transcriptional repressor of mexJK operon